MKFVDEFRNKEKVQQLAQAIRKISTREVRLMEVCGGHTMSIHKFGIPDLLPDTVKLLSGPGCPVCVSDIRFIDLAIAYAKQPDVIVTTFGDLIRVPGSSSSLDREKANGHNVRIVYSILDALKIARQNPDKKIVFMGIGFETTAPGTAVGILNAAEANLKNFFVLSSHKVMPPAMKALIDEGITINGYIGPGHVSTITGLGIYTELAEKFKVGVAIAGFEPIDLLQSIYMLVKQFENNDPKVEIQYKRVVLPEGNVKAWNMLMDVFEYRDDYWRGFGILPKSGLGINEKYARFDAEKMIDVEVEPTREIKGCICGLVLKGVKRPNECKLFGKACNPVSPVGACMVSNEGACAAYYRYGQHD